MDNKPGSNPFSFTEDSRMLDKFECDTLFFMNDKDYNEHREELKSIPVFRL